MSKQMTGPYRVLSSLACGLLTSCCKAGFSSYSSQFKGVYCFAKSYTLKNGFLTHENNNKFTYTVFSLVNIRKPLFENITLYLIRSKCSYFQQCNACMCITVIIDLSQIFWRARLCWPLFCLCRPFCIFERCLDSNPESCCRKQACY